MQIHAELRRKQSEIQDENCIVADIIELPESEYASLYQNLLRERGYLAERANMESFIDGQRCCVLVLGEGQEDGILVDSQGSSYARRSAFIPEARTIVRNHIRQLADYVVSEGTEHTEDGRWANTYDELYYHFGASITDTNGNGKLLREELQRRDEVNELIMTEDCIEINYHLAYCQNCGEGGISGTLDLLSLLGCNLYDVHFTCDGHDTPPVSRISADMLTEEGKREWADVLSAKVESITFENESFKCKLANCDPERLRTFTEMLNGQCDAEDYERWVKSSGITYPQTEDHSPTLSM